MDQPVRGFGPSFDLFFLWSGDLHSLSDKVRKRPGAGGGG